MKQASVDRFLSQIMQAHKDIKYVEVVFTEFIIIKNTISIKPKHTIITHFNGDHELASDLPTKKIYNIQADFYHDPEVMHHTLIYTFNDDGTYSGYQITQYKVGDMRNQKYNRATVQPYMSEPVQPKINEPVPDYIITADNYKDLEQAIDHIVAEIST